MRATTIAKGAIGTALGGLAMGIVALLKAKSETPETEVVGIETADDEEVVDDKEEE